MYRVIGNIKMFQDKMEKILKCFPLVCLIMLYKACRHIIKGDVIATMQEFFQKGMLSKVSNNTIVTLIPKTDRAKTIREFRPIAGCTTFYKIISKILTSRLGKVLNEVIHESQATFVPGKSIHNHILLAFELLKGYLRKGWAPRCMLHIDLQKAYDIVNWNSLEYMLYEIGLPHKFIDEIMLGTTTVT